MGLMQNIKRAYQEERSSQLARRSSMMSNKRGSWNAMTENTKQMVVFGVVIAIGAAIVVGVRDTFTEGTMVYNLVDSIVDLFVQLVEWGDIVLIVVIGAILLGLLYFFNR